jgi:hypothetical protein
MISKQKLFGNLNFNSILDNPDFKEDSVREVIILPILQNLGYSQDSIVRSKSLHDPFLKVGSNKKIAVRLVPDYCLKVENNFAWVLDAKAPNKNLNDEDYISQVYSYAYHPEIRSTYFALCNGLEFVLYKLQASDGAVLHFYIDEIDKYWERLTTFLAPNSFQIGKNITYDTYLGTAKQTSKFDYSTRPLLEEIPVRKQQAKRHFGVHGYFTKQSWNVVADYIKNYSKPGDWVLDPFGGSGVTAIEAMMNNRQAISIDINPLAVFLVKALIAPVKYAELADAFLRVKNEYIKHGPKTQEDIEIALKKYQFPKDIILPKGSDVETVEQLFSRKQLAQLACLKYYIKKEENPNLKSSLLLMFSGLLTKSNLTYHNNPNRPAEGQGNSAVFAYYRYRVAPAPVDVDIIKYYELRYKKVVEAKKEMEYHINEKTIQKH